MRTPESPDVENSLAALRTRAGISVTELARRVGVRRQTIHAMESGHYVPNTAVALRLARVLEVAVEELFRLPPATGAGEDEAGEAELLAGSEAPAAGQPVRLCRVDDRLVATPPSPRAWLLPPTDAVSGGEAPGGRIKVRIFQPLEDAGARILVAGCDPGISILARHARAAHAELVVAQRNSSQALQLLKEGSIHVAGTHLRDEQSGESNLPEIRRMFDPDAVAVITYAVWEEGIVTAPGNPRRIHGVVDMGWPHIHMVNREPGSGARRLLDAELEREDMPGPQLNGYDRVAYGHLEAAWHVRMGVADVAIATRAAAQLYGLGFVPLIAERYDLVIRRAHLDLPGIQALLDSLTRARFRRELEALGGYDTEASGRRVL